MKKILYLCLLLLMANQTIAAAAEEARPSIGARLCTLLSLLRPTVIPILPREEARPVARAVIPAPAVPDEASSAASQRTLVFTEILEHPKTLEEAVKTWRVCRARHMGIITLPAEGPSISKLYSAEYRADNYIIEKIRTGLTDDKKAWLVGEVIRTDAARGRAIFSEIFTDR